jgi:hypothetical protein
MMAKIARIIKQHWQSFLSWTYKQISHGIFVGSNTIFRPKIKNKEVKKI